MKMGTKHNQSEFVKKFIVQKKMKEIDKSATKQPHNMKTISKTGR
jgi:hypothetical protein